MSKGSMKNAEVKIPAAAYNDSIGHKKKTILLKKRLLGGTVLAEIIRAIG